MRVRVEVFQVNDLVRPVSGSRRRSTGLCVTDVPLDPHYPHTLTPDPRVRTPSRNG